MMVFVVRAALLASCFSIGGVFVAFSAMAEGVVQKVYGEQVRLLDKDENVTEATVPASALLNRPVAGRLARGAWVVESTQGRVIVDSRNIRTNADPNICVVLTTRPGGSQSLVSNGLSNNCTH